MSTILFESREESDARDFMEEHIGAQPYPPVHLVAVEFTDADPKSLSFTEWSATFDTTWYVVPDGEEKRFIEAHDDTSSIATLIDTHGWTEEEWHSMQE